jgi:AbrB-like transcriptional regulator
MAKKAKVETEATALTGKALLQKLKEIPHLSRREKARECGYSTIVADGKVRVSSGEFMNAVLKAKGISLETESVKKSRGKEAGYRTSVQKSGQLLIGSAYTQKMGLKPGDEFEIRIGYKHVRLVQVGTETED